VRRRLIARDSRCWPPFSPDTLTTLVSLTNFPIRRGPSSEALLNHSKAEIEGTYNLYEYWEERKEALRRWQETLARLQSGALESAA
jgi:hypothetical protein